MSNQIPITKQGMEKLRAELAHLKGVVRPEVIEAIAEARSHGDLSENAEYEAAKERQAFVEGRIREYEYMVSMAHVIEPKDIHVQDYIVFGATVTLVNCDTEQKITYQIVGEYEADYKQNKISVNSPIARALIGKEEGEIAEVNAPKGMVEYEIVKIEYI